MSRGTEYKLEVRCPVQAVPGGAGRRAGIPPLRTAGGEHPAPVQRPVGVKRL